MAIIKTDLSHEEVMKIMRKVAYQRTCPKCGQCYAVGVDGVIAGCDKCLGVVRLANRMIDYSKSAPLEE